MLQRIGICPALESWQRDSKGPSATLDRAAVSFCWGTQMFTSGEMPGGARAAEGGPPACPSDGCRKSSPHLPRPSALKGWMVAQKAEGGVGGCNRDPSLGSEEHFLVCKRPLSLWGSSHSQEVSPAGTPGEQAGQKQLAQEERVAQRARVGGGHGQHLLEPRALRVPSSPIQSYQLLQACLLICSSSSALSASFSEHQCPLCQIAISGHS